MEHAIEQADPLALARAIVESAIRDALHAVTDGAYHRSEQTDEEVWNAANDALRCLDSEHLLAPAPLREEWGSSGQSDMNMEPELRDEPAGWWSCIDTDAEGMARKHAGHDGKVWRRLVTAWEPADGIDRSEGTGGKAATGE